jgi:hypothetical protein
MALLDGAAAGATDQQISFADPDIRPTPTRRRGSGIIRSSRRWSWRADRTVRIRQLLSKRSKEIVSVDELNVVVDRDGPCRHTMEFTRCVHQLGMSAS